ncbi:aminoglycoside phosphotransferase [Jeotgalibacillus sp. S-D1]|uniref:phosphotransferase n=1 Tax=Jeotgalibacillus sp. S-D1 TaxID=2552189 RepID=UPI00105A9970|nr:phosphotransferase [Jeotgalibacillus sp. S-D1]TDL30850.1 aminoglycoside phosphotransferase [Jeotgalibacillus sp. S-D1]
MSDHSKEELLTGGNVSKVYRLGNTVRREMTENSRRVHALLKHLEAKNIEFTPRFLGIDEQGREILSFIEGEAGNYPLKDYMWSSEALEKIAKMQRRYHDAVKDFEVGEYWKPVVQTSDQAEVICHNDFAVYNMIFADGIPVGLIDFDVAGPGPVLWDIAYTLYTCVPLSRFYLVETGEKCFYQSSSDAKRIKERINLFFEAYGIQGSKDCLDMVLFRLEDLCKTIESHANEGVAAFQKMKAEGHIEHYVHDINFIRKHRHEWEE